MDFTEVSTLVFNRIVLWDINYNVSLLISSHILYTWPTMPAGALVLPKFSFSYSIFDDWLSQLLSDHLMQHYQELDGCDNALNQSFLGSFVHTYSQNTHSIKSKWISPSNLRRQIYDLYGVFTVHWEPGVWY